MNRRRAGAQRQIVKDTILCLIPTRTNVFFLFPCSWKKPKCGDELRDLTRDVSKIRWKVGNGYSVNTSFLFTTLLYAGLTAK